MSGEETPWYHGVKWTAVHYGADSLPTAIHASHNNRVCFMPTPGSHTEQFDRANIRRCAELIAKAPETATELDRLRDRERELVEALESLRHLLADNCGCLPVCQCGSQESLRIWKEDAQEAIRSILKGGE